MTQTMKSVLDSALEWSKTDPYRVLHVMYKKRHCPKIAPSIDQRNFLLSNGYEIIYVVSDGKILVDNNVNDQ